MALKIHSITRHYEQYEQRQFRSHDILTRHYDEVCGKLPEFKALDESVSALSVQYGKKLLNGEEKASPHSKKNWISCAAARQASPFKRRIPERLSGSGLECADCHDTGYIGSEKCHCFKKAVIQLLYEESNLKELSAEAFF